MAVDPVAESQPLTVMGEIVAVHGIRGAVKIYSHTDPLDSLLDYTGWVLRQGAHQHAVKVVSGRLQGRVLIVQLKGISDRNQALELVGHEVCVPSTSLPDLEPGEYYWHQLQGLQVFTLAGELLGVVDHLLETGANDVLVVKPCAGSLDQRERLLPYLPEDFIREIDLVAGRMQVDWDPEF
ncbi:ribosome maturation factor RimM [Halopseudomonas salegens]|uniref:Ribosome maturation factor RimM n=1 Tax=Halopseudomonas salegens TaxID=1434072 RepID=A0A1H2E8R3_9GAMM|nr:ribosome maturation factor RimM [Halopseudomonas salegens]SDT91541.1 16S rRNA processing protein RimM [Halopseudomonas salegens]